MAYHCKHEIIVDDDGVSSWEDITLILTGIRHGLALDCLASLMSPGPPFGFTSTTFFQLNLGFTVS